MKYEDKLDEAIANGKCICCCERKGTEPGDTSMYGDIWCRICKLESTIKHHEQIIRSASLSKELLPKLQQELNLLLEKE